MLLKKVVTIPIASRSFVGNSRESSYDVFKQLQQNLERLKNEASIDTKLKGKTLRNKSKRPTISYVIKTYLLLYS